HPRRTRRHPERRTQGGTVTFPDDYETIASIEWRYEAWEYDLTEVYRRKDGALFYADDSGCSCPTPFAFTTEAHLTPIPPLAVWHQHGRGIWGESESPGLTRRDVQEATAAIRKHLAAPTIPTYEENNYCLTHPLTFPAAHSPHPDLGTPTGPPSQIFAWPLDGHARTIRAASTRSPRPSTTLLSGAITTT